MDLAFKRALARPNPKLYLGSHGAYALNTQKITTETEKHHAVTSP
jgi:hypothetical protein